jgi:predicted nucleic acid-binding protein
MPGATAIRLVVDTNTLISMLIGGQLADLSPALADDRFDVFTAREQLTEFLDVI